MPERRTLCVSRHVHGDTIHRTYIVVYVRSLSISPGAIRRFGRRGLVRAHSSTSARRHIRGRSGRAGCGNVPRCASSQAVPGDFQPMSAATSFPESSSAAGSPVIGTVCRADSTPTSTNHGASSLHTHNGDCRRRPTLATGCGISGYRFNHVNTFAVAVSIRSATWAADTSSSASTQRPITHDHPPTPPDTAATAKTLASHQDARARLDDARYCPLTHRIPDGDLAAKKRSELFRVRCDRYVPRRRGVERDRHNTHINNTDPKN